VGYNGAQFGYPPSRFCDMHNSDRLCLVPGSIIGWGQIAFASADLERLEQALVALAFTDSPGALQFLDRYYFYDSPFRVIRGGPREIYGTALYFVIADNGTMVRNRFGSLATTSLR